MAKKKEEIRNKKNKGGGLSALIGHHRQRSCIVPTGAMRHFSCRQVQLSFGRGFTLALYSDPIIS